MKFKIETEIDLDNAKNHHSLPALGEFLRDQFFDQSKGLGCYSSFTWAEGVKSLPCEPEWDEESDPAVDDPDYIWICSNKNLGNITIKCRWYWDGDGTLEFIFPDGRCLSNSDCKKTHYWKLYK